MKAILPSLKVIIQVIGYTLMTCAIVILYFALFAYCDNYLR